MRVKPRGPLVAGPLLTRVATLLFIELCKDKDVFEYGSGGSTITLAQIAHKVTSIEDDKYWYQALQQALIPYNNVTYTLTTTRELPYTIQGMWDVVFVDCMEQQQRLESIREGKKHVRQGGWLIADDYNFPKVKGGVDELKSQYWDKAIVSGVKNHPIKNVPVRTSAAFCFRR